MSVRVPADHEMYTLCLKTLAVHGNEDRGGLAGKKIAALFDAIRLAQHAVYAVNYGADLHLLAMAFPTYTPPDVILKRHELKALYEALASLGANTVDRYGHRWLPDGMARLLDQVVTCTAVKAARF